VQLTNLVYVGVNQGRSLLAEPAVRRALSEAIDREAVAGQALSTRAVAVQTPFYPLL
jgi:ABC-type transport system substrate-binding protein